jgi:tRNA(Ile2) C34 agmatinyltransferase TiaS
MNGGTLLAVIAVVVVVFTVWRAYWMPLQRCPRCKDRVAGGGAGSSGKAFNLRCRACGGTGRQVRPLSRFLHATVNMPIRDKKR